MRWELNDGSGLSRCRHRWILETPNGPKVQGWCRLCRMHRVFPTVADDLWFGERSALETPELMPNGGTDADQDAA